MRKTAVRKQVSDFFGGKQVSGNRCLDMVPENRCRETGVLIPSGNRYRETGVLIPFGNRWVFLCHEQVTYTLIGNKNEGNCCPETGV